MTGKEFEAAVKAAGYTQKRFAEIMGVARTTIARQYEAEEVSPYWVYSLAGPISGEAARKVVELVSDANIAVVKK